MPNSISALMHPPFNCGLLKITVDILSSMHGLRLVIEAAGWSETSVHFWWIHDATSDMTATFVPYFLWERSSSMWLTGFCCLREKLSSSVVTGLEFNVLFSFVVLSVGITFQFPMAHDDLNLKILAMFACLEYIWIDRGEQLRPGVSNL